MYTGLSAASSGVILTSALLYSPPRRMVHWIWSPCRCYSDGHNLRAKWLQRSNKTRSKPLQCLIFRMDAVSYDWVIIQTRVQRYQCPFSDWIEVWPKWTSFYSPSGARIYRDGALLHIQCLRWGLENIRRQSPSNNS